MQCIDSSAYMVRVLPFCAYRPPVELAASLAAPPYDVISSDEAKRLADGNEHSFLRVNKPEIDLPASVSPYDLRVYQQGASNLQEFIEQGWLIKDRKPMYYIYSQSMGPHTQHGICGAVSVEEYATGVIRRHEKTQTKKENDRTRLTYAQNANVGPVLMMHRRHDTLNDIVQHITSTTEPETSFDAPDQVRHMVWAIDNDEWITSVRRAFASIKVLYIADGHHRSASAFRVGEMKMKQLIADGRTITGEEPCCSFLAVLFQASQLRILGYNRVIKDLNSLAAEEFLSRVVQVYHVRPLTMGEQPAPARRGEIGMCLRGRWYRLTTRDALVARNDPVQALDVQYLYDHLLHPVLAIGNPREDERIRYVGGIRGDRDLENLVKSERTWGSVAFSMYPVSVEEVMAIADMQGLMPPKATWFEPKLRSGLIVRLYSDG